VKNHFLSVDQFTDTMLHYQTFYTTSLDNYVYTIETGSHSLNISDVNAPLSLDITLSVDNGTLSFDDIAGLSSFSGGGTSDISFSGTIDDINIAFGTLSYSPEENFFGDETFTVTAVDPTEGLTTTDNYAITVNSINDAPMIVTNNGASLDEGSTSNIISAAMLAAEDIESGTSDLIYTITSLPNHGTVYLDRTELSSGETFTQDDIDNNKITYDHDGSEITSDFFSFTLSDGTDSIDEATFAIAITPVNDIPSITINSGATFDEGSVSNIISSSILSTIDADDTATDIIYTLTSLATNGTVHLDGSELLSGGTFSQDDIDNSKLTYSHDDSETASDTFSFTITDGDLTLSETSFSIAITPINDTPSITVNTGATFDESSIDNIISSSMLSSYDYDNSDTELTYTIIALPSYGSLINNDETLALGESFSQDDITQNHLSYSHTATVLPLDSFSFTLSDGTDTLEENSFEINILVPPTISFSMDLTTNDNVPLLLAETDFKIEAPLTQGDLIKKI
jgi:hypothetical protein